MRIAISGAGIAGPSLAYWLRKTGHTPTIIEIAPTFRAGGYVIDLWGVGYEVIRRMGLEDTIRDAGYHVQGVRSVDEHGRTTASFRTGLFGRIAGEEFISLPRGDLARAIYRTVVKEVETIFGDQITAIDQHDDGVRLSFQHAPDRDFDLVVGADGLHSNVRRLAFGPESDFEHYLGCHVAACTISGYPHRDELVYVSRILPDRQVARFALSDNRTLLFFVFRAKTPDLPRDDEECRARIRREFSGAGWETGQMLDALDRADNLYYDVVSQIRMEHWSAERLLLIGDAAACVSLLGGEGVGLAVTEAYLLAGELHRAGGDWRLAFEAWETRLRSFVKGRQKSARRFLTFFTSGKNFGIWFRNQTRRLMHTRPVPSLVADVRLRHEFKLPDYMI